MITIDMYYTIINEQVPKMNQQINKLETKEQKKRKLKQIKRNIYIGLNNVIGSQDELYQFILNWQDIDLSQIKTSFQEFLYMSLKKYMITNYMLDIEYNKELNKLIVSDHYIVYINLTTKQCSVSNINLLHGLSDPRDRFIYQMDYRDIDQFLTWQDFIE